MNDWFANRSRIEMLIITALRQVNHDHPGAIDLKHLSSISKRIYSVLREERRKAVASSTTHAGSSPARPTRVAAALRL